MADDVTFYDEIEAYAGRLSYRHGEQATLHVSTRADRFSVTVERWGATREQVWAEDGIEGVYSAPPTDADANGCGWPVSLTIDVPPSWTSGFYLVTCAAEGSAPERGTAHAGFVVRPGVDAAQRTLLVLATNTWNAYNNWGGCSLYTGGTQVAFGRPFGRGMLERPDVDRNDRKARPARWGEEPDVDGEIFQEYRFANGYPASIGSSGWFTFERRFVEWAEGEGFNFDFAISSDLENDSTALDGYDFVISVGHDEYWSAGQRDAIERHVEGGGNFASFSGNTMFWQVRIESTTPDSGGADVMVCHKYTAHETDPIMDDGDPSQMTGMWADPVVGRPESSFLGGGSAWGLYNRFGQATPGGSGAFTVYRHDHWLFDGTDLHYGDLLGAKHGVVGYETLGCRLQLDDYQLPISAGGDSTPLEMEVVAFTPSSNIGMGEYPKSISALSDQGDLEFIAARLFGGVNEDSLARCRYGNAVMLVCRPFGDTGGEVVTVGTTDWAFGLADDAQVARVTSNVIDRFSG